MTPCANVLCTCAALSSMMYVSRAMDKTTRRHIPDSYLHGKLHEVLKSHIFFYIYIPEQSSSMDQNPFVEAWCPSHTKRCHAFYGIARFIIVMQFYSVTRLKRNLETTQTCLQWKNSTVPGIWNSEDPNFAYLSQTEPALNGKKIRCHTVSL
jgi:hypothetical protein